jgi:replicative DNA helicase
MPGLAQLTKVTEGEIFRRTKRGSPPGVPTGLPSLDGWIGGWCRQSYGAVAADSGVGKSLLMSYWALVAAEALDKGFRPAFTVDSDTEHSEQRVAETENKPPIIVFFSLEMAGLLVTTRMLAQVISRNLGEHVDSQDLMFGYYPQYSRTRGTWHPGQLKTFQEGSRLHPCGL